MPTAKSSLPHPTPPAHRVLRKGDTLETFGTGRFTQGYPSITLRAGFGGMMDIATGLIYVGNGQYYDPATGRFLTRDARPGQNNPYTPIDPTSALLGPLALLALAYGRKKSRGKWDMLVVLLFMCLAVGMSLSACKLPAPVPSPTPTGTPTQPPATGTPTPGNNPGSSPTTEHKPSVPPSPTCTGTPTPTPSPIPSPTPNRNYNAIEAARWAKSNLETAGRVVDLGTNCTNFVSQALHYGGGLAMTDTWKPWESSMQCSVDTSDSVKTPDCPWIQTGDLHSYLIQKMGFRVRATFNAIPDYSNDETDKFDYLLLRAHDGWRSFVDNVQPGDLVFYHDTFRYQVWSHVAIAAQGRGHTNDVLLKPIANMPRVQEPVIVEHDGPGPDGTSRPFAKRTMGDTAYKYIGHVEILYQP